jgi:hypothetical protein
MVSSLVLQGVTFANQSQMPLLPRVHVHRTAVQIFDTALPIIEAFAVDDTQKMITLVNELKGGEITI